MNWESIKGAVAKAAPLLGGALGGPAGGAVGSLIAGALGVEEDPDQVARAIETDPAAVAKLRQLEQEHQRSLRRMTLEAETARLAQVNQTMRAEAQADDAFVRRWRPMFGYVASLTWTLQTGGIVYAMVASPGNAADLIEAITALTPMWGIALAVLGINVSARSRDKRVRAGQDGRGALERIADRFTGAKG
ncbi:3TM-type holin [Spiribacter halobius]|uniref:Holin of 3TMs, for gene-transfer release n=1 Tax=Sediminicurvatus halobius TaxID=2182432 RepID=A0A2U2N0S0_9GAMM|nr:3TM-type holin [Spiribacter halobius]PWG62841.1 hypothetical protein DEM34_10770 [Spiribacter halobius]UEX77009.1 holin family protein [Spiribacter halobius]